MCQYYGYVGSSLLLLLPCLCFAVLRVPVCLMLELIAPELSGAFTDVLLLLLLLACVQLYLFTRVLEFIAPELNRLSVGNILSDIKTSMMDEVDFTKVCYFDITESTTKKHSLILPRQETCCSQWLFMTDNAFVGAYVCMHAADADAGAATSLADVFHAQEAYHLQTFNDFLDKRGLRGVATAPYVYRQFSSKRCAPLDLQ
jgi:hypothetical protein